MIGLGSAGGQLHDCVARTEAPRLQALDEKGREDAERIVKQIMLDASAVWRAIHRTPTNWPPLRVQPRWNPDRRVWEIPNTENPICGHAEVFRKAWPASGVMRDGVAYEVGESRPLLRTPLATDSPTRTDRSIRQRQESGRTDLFTQIMNPPTAQG
jgi:hypothetical protein